MRGIDFFAARMRTKPANVAFRRFVPRKSMRDIGIDRVSGVSQRSVEF